MKKILISTENAEYQVIQSLKLNRVKRNRAGEVFIEGVESIKQAVSADMDLTRIIASGVDRLSDWAKGLIHENKDTKVIDMSFELYKKLCDREEPSEILATARVGEIKLWELNLPEKPVVLIFDRPSDYGNFGSIVRSANSFNVDAIFVVGHAIDVYDSKVIRSSLGSIFHSKIVSVESMVDLEKWIKIQKEENGMAVVGTDSTGSISLQNHQLKKPIALILGNEAKGMSVALKNLCDLIVRIPVSGAVNSLNVSCAGSILLWEIYKQSEPTTTMV